MTCGTCIRWRRRQRPINAVRGWRTSYGFCWWPGLGAKPYWFEPHPDGQIMVADVHGAGCAAFKEKKR